MGLFVRSGVKVEREKLERGRVYWVTDAGDVRDLGPATEEDWKLTAFVTEQAYKRLTPAKARTGITTLGRVRGFTQRLYMMAKST